MDKQIKDKLPYGTLLRFYELQNNVIDDFFVRGVHYMVKNFNNLHNGDSDCRTLLDQFKENELVFKFYTKFIVLEDVKSLEDDEFFTVPLFEQQINISSKKVLFMKVRKSYVIR